MRTFIAIDLDDAIKQEISLLLGKLQAKSRSVRWIRRQGMHVTLKFLGEIAPEKLKPVESVLEAVTKDRESFPMLLRGMGKFPPGRGTPRVIWVGIEENPSLSALQSALEDGLDSIHFPREKRIFHPHLTLGRVKSPSELDSIPVEIENNQKTLFGEMQVRKVTFFQSTLKPTGAEYSVISEYKLG